MNKKLKIILILIIAFSIVAAGILPIAKAVFWTKAGKDSQITIKQGEGTREIADNLKKENIISSAWVFNAFILAKHWYLQTGVYRVTSKMNLIDIATLIHEGKVEEYLVTIPEGWRVKQIDDDLAAKDIIQKGDLTKIATANEGYLFPDTYRLLKDITAEQIKNLMMENFKKKTAGMKITPQTIILASIIEREAKFDEDRPKIAGVYLNRLDIGMRLEADPTIQYGKGSWDPIAVADYKNFESPYNTYLHAGLPPGPICNPGLKSIEAVLFPQKDGFLYFFTGADGHAVFSKTLEEQEAKLKE